MPLLLVLAVLIVFAIRDTLRHFFGA